MDLSRWLVDIDVTKLDKYVERFVSHLVGKVKCVHSRFNAAVPASYFVFFLAYVYFRRHYWPSLGFVGNFFHSLNVLMDCAYPITGISSNSAGGLRFFRRVWADMTKFQPIRRKDLRQLEDKVITIEATEFGAESDKLPSSSRKVPIRIYRPNVSAEKEKAGLSVIVYYHGGGFVLGNIQSVEHICVEFCRQLEFIVVSVDYRLGEF